MDELPHDQIRQASPWFLTGASGEIGSYCVRLLNRAGVAPLVLMRRPMPPGAWQDARVQEVPGDLERLVAGDPQPELDAALAGARTVLHLAARVNLAGRGADQMQRLNQPAPAILFRRAQAANVARFVHVSTCGTVGCSRLPEPLDENAPYNLARFNNPYFDTKHSAEEALLALWRSAPERTGLIVVNPAINIGPQGSYRRLARRKEHPRRPPRPGSLLYKLLCFSFPGGLNLVDVRDVARGIILAALRGRPGERYILAGENLTFHDLMAHLRRGFGTSGPLINLPLGVVRTAGAACEGIARLTGGRAPFNRALASLAGCYWYYDSAKAVRELGYAARPFEETLRDLRAWIDDLRRG